MTVDDDVRIDQEMPLDRPEVSIPHYDEPGIRERWNEEDYDRRTARMWGF